jgi:hypothetical protein
VGFSRPQRPADGVAQLLQHPAVAWLDERRPGEDVEVREIHLEGRETY